MKNTKKVLCNGLAFSDKEDMEKLNRFAKEGWIFKEMKGLYYILNKGEPQDLIFDYDIAAVSKEELDDYNQIFINAGWTPLKNNYDYHFFSAKTGTPTIHTDKNLLDQKYKPIAKWSLGVFLISSGITIAGFSLGWLNPSHMPYTILLLLSAGCAGGSGVGFIGSYFRSKGKRLSFKKFFYHN